MDAGQGPFRIFPPSPPLIQPREGYRYSIDSLLLASFAAPRPRDRVVDLGCGCGVLSIVLAERFSSISVTAIELQEELCTAARKNIEAHGLSDRVEVVCGDVKECRGLFQSGSFDYAVSNPPFRPVESGRICPEPGEALARHEIALDLEGLMAASRFLLRPGGRLALVYPSSRLAALLHAMREARVEPKRLMPVYPAAGEEARLVLVEGCRDGSEEVRFLPPLFIDQVVKERRERVS